jgi:hypothetical protein
VLEYLMKKFGMPSKLLRASMHHQLWRANRNPT